MTLLLWSKVPSHQGFPGTPTDGDSAAERGIWLLCSNLTSLLQSYEGSTKDGESMHLLEHSPADPFTRNIGQVSGNPGGWDGKT